MMAYREFLACSDPLAGPIGCFLCAGVEPVTNVERAGPRSVTGVTSKQGVSQRGLASACWADDHYPRSWKFRRLLAKSQRKEGQEQQMSSWPHNAHLVLGVWFYTKSEMRSIIDISFYAAIDSRTYHSVHRTFFSESVTHYSRNVTGHQYHYWYKAMLLEQTVIIFFDIRGNVHKCTTTRIRK